MTKDKKNNNFNQGMKTRREVLGNMHVDRAIKNTNQMDKRFQDFITESAWGTLWSNEKLSMHFNASKNTGATVDEISEALMHVAVYAGVPASNNALKILKRVFKESN